MIVNEGSGGNADRVGVILVSPDTPAHERLWLYCLAKVRHPLAAVVVAEEGEPGAYEPIPEE